MNVAFPPVLNPENDVYPPEVVVMVALSAVLVPVNLRRKLFVMAALPAVLLSLNNADPPKPVVMAALLAVLLLVNANCDAKVMKKFGAFEELLTMPVPAIVKFEKMGMNV